MPYITPSRGPAGATFNGGTTLTAAPTVLSPSDKDAVALQVRPVAGATADATDEIEVYDDAGVLLGYWDASGNIGINSGSLSVNLASGRSSAFALNDGTVVLGIADGHVGISTKHSTPSTASLSSGTGSRFSTFIDVRAVTPVTFNPTAGAAATCAVAVSPDNVTYTALWTETEPAGVALDGTIHGLVVFVPALWYLKLTVVNATIGTTTYY